MQFNKIKIILIVTLTILILGALVQAQDEVDEIVNRLLQQKKNGKNVTANKPADISSDHLEGATQQTWEFIAEGSAALSPGMDKTVVREQAIRDALRNAVEQGVGIFVGSTTLVRSHMVDFDKIFTQAAGYVRRYNVINEWTDNGVFRVKVVAEIGMGKLQSDLMAVETFKSLVDYPTIMVIGKESIDGSLAENSRLAQTAIESMLTENGYDLKDRAQIEALNIDKIKQATSPEEISAVARKLGADIIIDYDAEATFAGEDNIYGMRTFFYTGVVNYRVIKASTARNIIAGSVRVRRGAEGRPSAAQAALHYAGKSAGEKLKAEILRSWASEVLEQGVWIEVKIANVDYDTAFAFTETIQKWRNINAVRKPNFSQNTAIYQVRANMTAPTLAHLLSTQSTPQIKIDEVTQNSIKARCIKKSP